MTMSNIRVYTRDGSESGLTPVAGSKIFVGDTELRAVTGVELEGDPRGVWTLKISVHVDPAKLFSVLPGQDMIETTNLMSAAREYVARKA